MSIPPACLQGAQQPLLATLPFFFVGGMARSLLHDVNLFFGTLHVELLAGVGFEVVVVA